MYCLNLLFWKSNQSQETWPKSTILSQVSKVALYSGLTQGLLNYKYLKYESCQATLADFRSKNIKMCMP